MNCEIWDFTYDRVQEETSYEGISLQDRIDSIKDFDFDQYDEQEDKMNILEKFIMHTTDKDGNQITLEYAENLLEKFKEFMALAA